MTFSIMTLFEMTFSIRTLSIMTFRTIAFSITFSMMIFGMTLSITALNAGVLGVIMQNVFMLNVVAL